MCLHGHLLLSWFKVKTWVLFFSSPEPQAQVSCSDHNFSVVVMVVVVYVNFSHFHLLKNNWTNYNQNWQKASLGEGDSSLRGDKYEIAKLYWGNFRKSSSPEPPYQISNKLGTKQPLVIGIQVCQMKSHALFHGEIIMIILIYYRLIFI